MMLKKDPVIKKAFIILIASLVLIISIVILNNHLFINQLRSQGINVDKSLDYKFLLKSMAIMFLIFILNVFLFISILKYIVKKLEKVSFDMDRIMDGDYSIVSNVDKEGILSRLESQFAQMSRRLQLNINDINAEKENVKSLVTDVSHQIRTPLASIKWKNWRLI